MMIVYLTKHWNWFVHWFAKTHNKSISKRNMLLNQHKHCVLSINTLICISYFTVIASMTRQGGGVYVIFVVYMYVILGTWLENVRICVIFSSFTFKLCYICIINISNHMCTSSEYFDGKKINEIHCIYIYLLPIDNARHFSSCFFPKKISISIPLFCLINTDKKINY